MHYENLLLQFISGVVIGFLIACSPTKFGKNKDMETLCDSSVVKCVVESGSTVITQNFKVGAGKVDILFIDDNSASMSKNQVNMANKFVGFIQSLDQKSIDYKIALTTTDYKFVSKNSQKLIVFGNGKKFITKDDNDRVSFFNNAIVRRETIDCEDFIISMFNTYGSSFQLNTSNSLYAANYSIKCPSPDTRGIYIGNTIISENTDLFMRTDANLNIILISNDNVRQGKSLEENDTASAFNSMMVKNYPNKYWSFNSIIVKDDSCKQLQTLSNALGKVVMNQSVPAIAGGLGIEYANLSNSSAVDIDNNPRPRGQVLDICENDYTHNFATMATQISDEARMVTLKCTPSEAPAVTFEGIADSSRQVPHKWSANKITFEKGSEGMNVKIIYKCYTGPT